MSHPIIMRCTIIFFQVYKHFFRYTTKHILGLTNRNTMNKACARDPSNLIWLILVVSNIVCSRPYLNEINIDFTMNSGCFPFVWWLTTICLQFFSQKARREPRLVRSRADASLGRSGFLVAQRVRWVSFWYWKHDKWRHQRELIRMYINVYTYVHAAIMGNFRDLTWFNLHT